MILIIIPFIMHEKTFSKINLFKKVEEKESESKTERKKQKPS